MHLVIGVLSIFPVLLAGDLLVQLFNTPKTKSIWVRGPLAYGFGWGLVLLILLYTSWIFSQYALSITVAFVFMLALTNLVLNRNKMRHTVGNIDLNFSWQRITSILLLIFFSSLVCFASFKLDLGFDGIRVWGLKAKILFHEAYWSTENLSWVSHPSYPLLVPVMQAWVYSFIGKVDVNIGKLPIVFSYLALISLFFGSVRYYLSTLLSLLFTFLLALTPQLVTVSAISGYADVTLAFYILSGILFLFFWFADRKVGNLFIGAMMLALTTTVKREGNIYWALSFCFLVLFVIFISKHPLKKNIQSVGIYLLPAVFVVMPWFVYLKLNNISNADFSPISLQGFITNTVQFPVIISSFLKQLFVYIPSWGILWWIFVFVTLTRWRSFRAFENVYLWGSAVLPIILLGFAFIYSDWEPLINHLAVSTERIVLHAAPLAWLFIALQTSDLDLWLKNTLFPHANSNG
ncbi:MAG: hypothetical protein R6X34_01015 [Chloroflexota bacterium]